MAELCNALAALLEKIANFGAGTVSQGMGYEPEVPEELK